MASITETFAVGSEQVTAALDVELPSGETIITGDFAGAVPVGTTARLRGNVRLTGDLHVRGTLLCDPSGVDLDGQGLWDIHTHDGILNLQGVEKTAWCRWGDIPVGWQVGDRLAVAPTAVGVFLPSETTWQGSWAATTRPTNSPDVTLVDGTVARPEVANLSQTVTLRNLKRIMIHEASAPNPQTLKWIRVLNSGVAGVLTMYPIHFHLLYDFSRGSLLEGVVVEGGKNHAFVPHGSHGITQLGCVAYNIISPAYWWDPPPDSEILTNDSTDIIWDDCLAMLVHAGSNEGNSRTAGFSLGAGKNVRCNRSVAVCVQGNPGASAHHNRQRSGFHWPEGSSVSPTMKAAGTRTPWEFHDCVGHNNVDNGLLVWQNARAEIHEINDFVAFHNGFSAIFHGSYINRYFYNGGVIRGDFRVVAKSPPEGPMRIEDIVSDSRMLITSSGAPLLDETFIRRCTFPSVTIDQAGHPAWNVFEDCGLVPADFELLLIAAESILEIKEAGVLTHRWANGVWS